MEIIHKEMAKGGWNKLSLAEQMGNIGSEIHRAINWQNRDKKIFNNSINRALELLDLTINDTRWKSRLKEILRVRELICSAAYGSKKYKTTLEEIDDYLLSFAIFALKNKN